MARFAGAKTALTEAASAYLSIPTMTFHQTPNIFSHFKRKRAQVCLRNMLLLRLGLPVHVNDHNIQSFEAMSGRLSCTRTEMEAMIQ